MATSQESASNNYMGQRPKTSKLDDPSILRNSHYRMFSNPLPQSSISDFATIISAKDYLMNEENSFLPRIQEILQSCLSSESLEFNIERASILLSKHFDSKYQQLLERNKKYRKMVENLKKQLNI